jgi:hypothetical protein
MSETTTSAFNRALKLLLRQASELTDGDENIIALRRAYIAAKIEDETAPMRAFWAAAQDARSLVVQRDRKALCERFASLKLDVAMTVDEAALTPLWALLDTMYDLAERVFAPPADVLSTLDTLETRGPDPSDRLDEVLKATTKVLPNVFKELGMDVGQAEIEEATQKLTAGPLSAMLKGLMNNADARDANLMM